MIQFIYRLWIAIADWMYPERTEPKIRCICHRPNGYLRPEDILEELHGLILSRLRYRGILGIHSEVITDTPAAIGRIYKTWLGEVDASRLSSHISEDICSQDFYLPMEDFSRRYLSAAADSIASQLMTDGLDIFCIPMELPGGLDISQRITSKALSLRMLRYYDPNQGLMVTRFDVLYGHLTPRGKK